MAKTLLYSAGDATYQCVFKIKSPVRIKRLCLLLYHVAVEVFGEWTGWVAGWVGLQGSISTWVYIRACGR